MLNVSRSRRRCRWRRR
jgi:hypothetical protein